MPGCRAAGHRLHPPATAPTVVAMPDPARPPQTTHHIQPSARSRPPAQLPASTQNARPSPPTVGRVQSAGGSDGDDGALGRATHIVRTAAGGWFVWALRPALAGAGPSRRLVRQRQPPEYSGSAGDRGCRCLPAEPRSVLAPTLSWRRSTRPKLPGGPRCGAMSGRSWAGGRLRRMHLRLFLSPPPPRA